MKQDYTPRPYGKRAVALTLAALVPVAWASQVTSLGHTGAVNTPTAAVLPTGTAALAITNSVPEWKQLYTNEGAFGALVGGFGLLPGLEVFGRLAYDGDLQCNQYLPGCNSRTRDLSLNAKYQLPLKLPLDTRVAVGVTDFGGAATNFRQTYVVATAQLGPVDVSLGKSNSTSATALMHGVFGSAELHLTPQLAIAVEDDTRTRRAGAHYTMPVTRHLDFQVGLSKRLTGSEDQKSAQLQATLLYVPEAAKPAGKRIAKDILWGEVEPSIGGNALVDAAQTPAPAVVVEEQAQRLLALLEAAGFMHVSISVYPATDGQARVWVINAEPTLWRQDALAAVRAALPHWAAVVPDGSDELLLTLTYVQQPKISVSISRYCVDGLSTGQLLCTGRQPLQILTGNQVPAHLKPMLALQAAVTVQGTRSARWKPQIELGVDLRNTVGTEYGLADYSMALDVGGELAIGKGWFLQGHGVVPISASEDYKEGGVFYGQSHQKAEFRQGLLSYWGHFNPAWPGNLAWQVSAGAINASSAGAQLDSVWQNVEGNWRVGGTVGAYQQRLNPVQDIARQTALVSVRNTLIPGYWQVEGIAGQFFRGDVGYRINSHHWLGAQRLTLFYRSTDGQTAAMPKTSFAGFELSFPFGGAKASDLGWATARGRDRFGWGLATKVGDTNNNLTHGYGEVVRPRHGVWTDVLDHDRAGAADARKNLVIAP